ncbi:MAG: pyridoxal phosphate-dependent aminotransferase [Acidobacteria bacterium]|nr:pyridoxal phosphate-dependent aminotransferase [Acidobacteriota bacterium]MBS1866909.1 pyridoxal phosphate-dependent aminotransferase [Acidobacteriota bacterium]
MFASRTSWNLAENRLTQALAEHRRAERSSIDLTLSNPTEAAFSYDESAILHALQNPGSLRYEPVSQGLLSAREAVASYYSEKSVPLSPNDLFLTTSTSEAYSYLFRLLCNPGDEVLIPSPSYPLFDFLAELNDVALVRYPLVYDHGWQIDFASLERLITPRTRVAIVVHPNNPTGHYAKPPEQTQLASFCAASNLAVIADEVFLDFPLEAAPAAPFALQTKALTFSLSGLSKLCGLPQMKSAWIALSGPETLIRDARRRLEVIADSYLSMNAPVQHALPALLQTRAQFQAQLIARALANLAMLDKTLAAQNSCSRLVCEAGWNVVLRVPATRTGEDLAVELLQQQGVLVHPGHFYDFPQDGYLVLSLLPPKTDFAEGTRRLLAFFA